MPDSAYTSPMGRAVNPPRRPPAQRKDKPLVWMAGELKTPPMSSDGTLAIAILDVFAKSTRGTPDDVIRNCKRRLADFKTKDKP